MSNSTRCYTKKAPEQSPPLFQNGNLVIQAHHVGWLISGIFAAAATIASFWLISKHIKWYTNKRQQRYIVRILLMVPIYANVSLISYILWNHSTPILLIRDAYESVVLTAFFYLLLQFLSSEPAGQKEIFRKIKLEKWVFPFGWVKWKPQDGLYFLQLMKWGILQYCFLRPTTTLAAVILDMVGLYCEDSWSPAWGHIYITITLSISVTVAMYCLIQLYVPVSNLLAPHKPILKLFSVKAVVFLTFWQATLLSGLSLIGIVKDTKYMTADDINIGIGAILETFEMMLFAFIHFKAFTYRPYVLPSPNTFGKWRAILHVLDFRETLHELGEGVTYLWENIRGRDPEPIETRRVDDLEKVFGKERRSWYVPTTKEKTDTKGKGRDMFSDAEKSILDPYIVSALGSYIPVMGNRKHAWDDDDAWIVDGEISESQNSPLTAHNLRSHDKATGSAPRPREQNRYRPVSSLIPDYELPRTPDPFDSSSGRRAPITLDDPPPPSIIHTYSHMRGPELRRMYREANDDVFTSQGDVRLRTSPTSLPSLQTLDRHVPTLPLPPSPTSVQLTRSPNPPYSPLQLPHSADLGPSVLRSHLSDSLSTYHSSADEFYDFDEVYVYDPVRCTR